MERLRSVDVSIAVDTNKDTRSVDLSLEEDESIDEFIERIRQAILERLP